MPYLQFSRFSIHFQREQPLLLGPSWKKLIMAPLLKTGSTKNGIFLWLLTLLKGGEVGPLLLPRNTCMCERAMMDGPPYVSVIVYDGPPWRTVVTYGPCNDGWCQVERCDVASHHVLHHHLPYIPPTHKTACRGTCRGTWRRGTIYQGYPGC